jgi:hypothetical protein
MCAVRPAFHRGLYPHLESTLGTRLVTQACMPCPSTISIKSSGAVVDYPLKGVCERAYRNPLDRPELNRRLPLTLGFGHPLIQQSAGGWSLLSTYVAAARPASYPRVSGGFHRMVQDCSFATNRHYLNTARSSRRNWVATICFV